MPGERPISLGCNTQPKKEKKMNKCPFHVNYESFETLDEAVKAAKKSTMRNKEDTVISQDISVVKFPVPDYEVEAIVPKA
jgi:hypothetical protein